MEFIKKMKKREFIEMGLKTLASVLAAFLAIILLEAMIFGIQLNALYHGGNESITGGETVAYAIQQGDEDKYFVLFHTENDKAKMMQWTALEGTYRTKAQVEALKTQSTPVKDIVYRTPNAFELSIDGWHYAVMAVIVAAVAGFFTYKFIALAKSYKKIETEFKTNGTIEFV